MGGRIDSILMCVKFGYDTISNLDFSFIGDVPLIHLNFHSVIILKSVIQAVYNRQFMEILEEDIYLSGVRHIMKTVIFDSCDGGLISWHAR